MRRLAHSIALSLATLALFALVTACGARTVVTERTIDQLALVPAPSGPHAAGPTLARDQVALEGALTTNAVEPGGTREGGQLGHQVVRSSGRGRVAIGLGDSIEVGFDAEYHSASFSEAVPGDVGGLAVEDRSFWRLGPQLRIHGGDDQFRVGALFEASLTSLPYTRRITEQERTTYWNEDIVGYDENGEPIYEAGEPTTEVGPTRTWRENETTLTSFFRAGLFAQARLTEWLVLNGGGLIQDYPAFFGKRRADGVCHYDGGDITSNDCEGSEDESDVEPYEVLGIGTLFGSLTFDLTPVSLIAQFYTHVAGDARLIEATPFGGEIIVRLSF